MSILFWVWLTSLLIIVGTLFYGHRRLKKSSELHEHPRVHMHDLFMHEVGQVNTHFVNILERMKPHGIRTARAGLVIVKRGQDIFIRRVYGRMNIERGATSSFFLKHISEHKEHSKRDR